MFRVKSLNHTFTWKNFQTPNTLKAIELTTRNISFQNASFFVNRVSMHSQKKHLEQVYQSFKKQETSNRPFSKMAAKNSIKLKLKTYTSTIKSTFTLVTLQSFSISDLMSAEKM